MTYIVTGSPLGPFGDAVLAALLEDGNLRDIVSDRVYASLPVKSRTPFPYIVGDRRELAPGAVAMQKDGGQVSIFVHVWSEQNSPDEVQRAQARIRAVLSRDRLLRIDGYAMYAGSLDVDQDMVIPDFDPDMPQKSLYHGVQRVSADVETAA